MDNFTMIIFGATGDLSARKLMPSLIKLARLNRLSATWRIIGAGRTAYSNSEYRAHMYNQLKELAGPEMADQEYLTVFCDHLEYITLDYQEVAGYHELARAIQAPQDRCGICDNLLFYIATPPSVAPAIVKNLAAVHLNGQSGCNKGWRKIILEKPYGSDYGSAKDLDDAVASVFQENQIYRVDHYLAKETTQNLLIFRFSNGIFEPLWNRNYIDRVVITIAEDFGVRHRGEYYEEAGLIRDVIQNHGLQLLALMAMEPPVKMKAEAIRDERVKVLRAIRRGSTNSQSDAVFGQYVGYQTEPKVASDSRVETFAQLTFYVDNWRWKDVPFIICAGKNMPKTITEIQVDYQKPPHFFMGMDGDGTANQVIFTIQPEERIAIKFGTKRPGESLITDPVNMCFDYRDVYTDKGLSAYHRLLIDAIEGDQTRFIRRDEVLASWKIIDSIRAAQAQSAPLPYAPGTWGPLGTERHL